MIEVTLISVLSLTAWLIICDAITPENHKYKDRFSGAWAVLLSLSIFLLVGTIIWIMLVGV